MPNAVRAFASDNLGTQELAVSAASGADNLPSGLIISPGIYNVFGVTVDMTEERFYDVTDFDARSVRVIVYASDFDKLVSSIAWASGQIGYADVTYSAAMLQAVRTRVIDTTCGAISMVAQSLLAEVNIPSRWTGGAAFAGFNNYDDGHTILEVRHGGKWIAIDFLMKLRFFAADGVTPLSHLELHDALTANLPVVFSPIMPWVAPANTSKYSSLHNWIRSNPLVWYKRIFEMVYVPSGGSIFMKYDSPAQQASIPPRGSIPVSRANYIADFYGKTFVGQQPNTTSSWGALYTVADTNLQIYPGENVASIGAYLDSPAAVQMKVMKQITPQSHSAMVSYLFAHPGGGWADFTIPGGYVAPAIGLHRPGMSANPGTVPFSTVGTRAIFVGDLPAGQSGAFSYATNGGIAMRWTAA